MTARTLGLVLIAVATAALGGCDRKDPEKCRQALETARSGAAAGQFDGANEWRNYAYKHCEDPSELQKLDQDIVAKKTALAKAEAAKKALDSETFNLLKLFRDFVGDSRQDPSKATATMKCGTNEEKGKEDEVWCTGTRWVNRDRGYKIDVRYWKAEPAAAHFRVRALGEVKCDGLGGKASRKWEAGSKFWYCALSEPPTNGLWALVERTEKETRIEVFSKAYLDRDPKLAARTKP